MCGIGALASLSDTTLGFGGIRALLEAMEERGTEHGAGFARYRDDGKLVTRAFSRSPRLPFRGSRVEAELGRGFYSVAVDEELPLGALEGDVWVYQSSRYLDVFKSIGWPHDVARAYGLEGLESRVWIGHTRYPTNSPGFMPWLAHPFSSGDVAVVHNGDLSSYGINARAVEKLLGIRRLTGNDSEVIAHLLRLLLTREGMDPWEAMQQLQEGRGWRRLDGPYAVIALWGSNEGPHLMAFVDKHHFRPLYIARDDKERIAIASEAGALRSIMPSAEVSMLRGGGRVIVWPDGDLEAEGVSEASPVVPVEHFEEGWVDASGLGGDEVNRVIRMQLLRHGVARVRGLQGQRYIANGMRGGRLELEGVVGNASLNLVEDMEVRVYGDVQEDVGDSMRDSTIAIWGNAGDALGQAMRSGFIAVRGAVGNRLGIQMKGGCIVVGGSVGDFAGEYMAGGCMILLGSVGKFLGAGMVGGKIYAFEHLDPLEVGSPQPRSMIERYLDARRGMQAGLLEKRLAVIAGALELGKPRVDNRYLKEDEKDEVVKALVRFVEFFPEWRGVEESVYSNRFTVVEAVR